MTTNETLLLVAAGVGGTWYWFKSGGMMAFLISNKLVSRIY